MLFNRLVVETKAALFATALFYTPWSPTLSQIHSREQFEIPHLGNIFQVPFSVHSEIACAGDISDLHLIINALFKN